MNRESFKNCVKNGKITLDPNDDNGFRERDFFNLAHAFGRWLKEKMSRDNESISVAVGTDNDDMSVKIKDVFLKSFTVDKFFIYDAQKTYIPALFKMTVHQNVIGCVYISRPGIKTPEICIEFITRLGVLTDKDIFDLIDCLTYSTRKTELIVPDFSLDSNLKHYAERARQNYCRNINSTDYQRPLRGFKFVVDTNNGMGSYVVDKILLPLGAEVVEVSGVEIVARQCRNVCANAGFVFDYNMQSLHVVSRKYGMLGKEALTYLLSQTVPAQEKEDVTILTDYFVTSKTKELSSQKFNCIFKKISDDEDLITSQKNLIENGTNCPLAVYGGGKCSFSDNLFIPDAAFTLYMIILKIASLREDGITIDDFLEPFYTKSGKWKIKVTSHDKEGYAKTVMTAFEGHCLKDDRLDTTVTENSVICRFENFEFEVKIENFDYFAILIKCENAVRVNKILFWIYSFFKNFNSLNIDEIKNVF